jgi:CRP/FNR family transcriptional regulator
MKTAARLPFLSETLLRQFPACSLRSFGPAETIYGIDRGVEDIYQVADGTVTVSRLSDPARPVLVGIYQTGEVFGETSLLGSKAYPEVAVALGKVTVRAWPVSAIEELATNRPEVGIALCRIVTERATSLELRIACFASDTIPRRIARSLIDLAERLSDQHSDGAVSMLPLTHLTLAQYVGTSREIITRHMNQLRRRGYLKYSRQGIQLHRHALQAMLRGDGPTALVAPGARTKEDGVQADRSHTLLTQNTVRPRRAKVMSTGV